MPEFQGLSLDDLSEAGTLAWEEGEFSPQKRLKTLAFEGKIFFYSIVLPLAENLLLERDPLTTGTTKGDQMFHTGSALGFPLTRPNDDDGNQEEDTLMRSSNGDDDSDGSKEVDGNRGKVDGTEEDENNHIVEDDGDNYRTDSSIE
jgi:hypothetical protein